MTASLATAKEISMNGAVAVVLSELGGVFTLIEHINEEQHWAALKAFLVEKMF